MRIVLCFLVLMFAAVPSAEAQAPTSNYAHWSYGNLYLERHKIYWASVSFTFRTANGQTFTGWEKDGHRCPNRPALVLNYNNPEWKETMRVILAAGLAGKPMHVWFWGQVEAENNDPDRRCYLQGVTVTLSP